MSASNQDLGAMAGAGKFQLVQRAGMLPADGGRETGRQREQSSTRRQGPRSKRDSRGNRKSLKCAKEGDVKFVFCKSHLTAGWVRKAVGRELREGPGERQPPRERSLDQQGH